MESRDENAGDQQEKKKSCFYQWLVFFAVLIGQVSDHFTWLSNRRRRPSKGGANPERIGKTRISPGRVPRRFFLAYYPKSGW